MAKNEMIAIFETFIAIIKKSNAKRFVILIGIIKSVVPNTSGAMKSINYLREVQE
ncbi:MAG: hypothetical protein NC429_02050 [Lachnospiraceae bacterium]|nr:hypothetical protein [Lachnospiraceae bacterium]